jgi:hypothetical protein
MARFSSKPVLTGLSLTNWKDQDCGPGPVQFIGPMWSLGLDI